jgi:transposase
MEFRELSDEQWQFIQRRLPPKASTGRPRADDRRTLNGILYVPVTGCRWAAGQLRRPRPFRLRHDRLESSEMSSLRTLRRYA